MDKLQTNITGGFPFNLDDLRFQDDAYRLAFADVCKTIVGHGPVILFGCETAKYSTYISVSEGAIFHLGEVWHVYPHNFTAPNPLVDMPNWSFVTANGPEGSRTFENGETHQVHQVRKAVGSYFPISGALGNVPWDMIPRFENVNNSTSNLQLMTVIELPGRINPSRSIKAGRIVSIDCGFTFIVLGSVFIHAATIKNVEHYPADIIEGLVPAHDSADPQNPDVLAMYKIDIDGKIYFRRLAHTGSPTGASIRLNTQYVK